MDAYRKLMSVNPKVKRKELLSEVTAKCEGIAEHITEKMFDLYLRQFCYVQGQTWLPKPRD